LILASRGRSRGAKPAAAKRLDALKQDMVNESFTEVSDILLRLLGNTPSDKAMVIQLLIGPRKWIQET